MIEPLLHLTGFTPAAFAILRLLLTMSVFASKYKATEAAKSKEKVVNELEVPDPELAEAKKILDPEEEDADSEGND